MIIIFFMKKDDKMNMKIFSTTSVFLLYYIISNARINGTKKNI